MANWLEPNPFNPTLRLYHGTNAEPFWSFDPKRFGSETDEGQLGRGVYLSTDPNIARNRRTVIVTSAKLHRPLRIAMSSWGADKSRLASDALGLDVVRTGRALTRSARARGYDSIILDYSPLGYEHQEVVVFDPKQVEVVEAKEAA